MKSHVQYCTFCFVLVRYSTLLFAAYVRYSNSSLLSIELVVANTVVSHASLARINFTVNQCKEAFNVQYGNWSEL